MGNRHGFINSNSRQGFISAGEGGDSASVTNTYTAGENISQYDFVIIKDDGADNFRVFRTNNQDDDCVEFVGVALDSATTGNTVTVQHAGTVTNPSWSWSFEGEPIFADGGVNKGKGTQSQPTINNYWIIHVGQAVAPDTVLVNAAGSATAVKITGGISFARQIVSGPISIDPHISGSTSLFLYTGTSSIAISEIMAVTPGATGFTSNGDWQFNIGVTSPSYNDFVSSQSPGAIDQNKRIIFAPNFGTQGSLLKTNDSLLINTTAADSGNGTTLSFYVVGFEL